AARGAEHRPRTRSHVPPVVAAESHGAAVATCFAARHRTGLRLSAHRAAATTARGRRLPAAVLALALPRPRIRLISAGDAVCDDGCGQQTCQPSPGAAEGCGCGRWTASETVAAGRCAVAADRQ